MGLLTDNRSGQNALIEFIIKRHNILCYLLYLGGISLFLVLAHESLNNKTYFSENALLPDDHQIYLIKRHKYISISLYFMGIILFMALSFDFISDETEVGENALLPGLVNNEFRDENLAMSYHEELLEEQKKYPTGIPYAWLLAKFSQIGLDTYTHNFTLHYPLADGRSFRGKNVYAILRAPRAASTEALVLSTPYRPPNSAHQTTAASIALMLSFAKFCKQQKYWAKDIIFLIVEHEQLGMQAWLESYLGIERTKTSALNSGMLIGRAGAIQAAINLEFHSEKIGYIDIKIEGLNGQLPNLDLVNLAERISTMERIRHTFKQRSQNIKTDSFNKWFHSFETLISMVLSLATGVPTGNHGLFHRYGIEAITLQGFPREGNQNYATFYTQGRLLEGIFRSLNNLIEKFHQSYFFYLLPSLNRFVSIGTYIGSLIAFTAALLVKALALWLQIRDKPEEIGLLKSNNEPSSTSKQNSISTPEIIKIGTIMLLTHALGIIFMNIPSFLTRALGQHNLNTEQSLYYGFCGISLFTLVVPFICRLEDEKSAIVLNIIALLEFATALTAIGSHNFSLGFLIGAIYVPWILLISPISKSSIKTALQIIIWLICHPFLIMSAIVMVYTYVMFPEENFKDVVNRGIFATQQALVFTIVDSLIYGNWLFNVVTAIFVPTWMSFYCMFYYQVKNVDNKVKKE